MLSDHLEKLSVFRAIASTGTFRGASELLKVTQPTLTRSVQSLEAELGVLLFERSVRGVTLTSEGELLLDYAEGILEKAEDIEVSIKNINDKLSGVISIGTYQSLSVYFWPKLLSRLKKTAPNLQIKLNTSNNVNQIDELSKRKLKMVVDVEPRPHLDMVSIPLYKDKFNFYATPKLKVNDSTPFIYVSYAYDENEHTIPHLLRSKGVHHSLCYDVDSFETAKAFAVEGLGIAVLPSLVAATAQRKLKRVSIPDFPKAGFGVHSIFATFNEESRSDRRVNMIVAELKNYSKSLYASMK